MAKLARLVAVIVLVGAVGLLFVAAAFQVLGTAQSGGVLLGLFATLITLNVLMLRHGVRWALKPIVKSAVAEQPSGNLTLSPTQ